jgi:RNA polymerase sigma factor (sigma-70 family)
MLVGDHSQSAFGPSWQELCVMYYSRLMNGARRLANGRVDEAEDLVQETICQALNYKKDPAEVQNPAGYLSRIMFHIWVDKWASENRGNVESLDALLNTDQHPTVQPEVFRVLHQEELSSRFASDHGPLTEREELLLQLHLKGFKNQEIAEELNEDVRVIRYDLNAVKAKVRYRLKPRKSKTAKGQ